MLPPEKRMSLEDDGTTGIRPRTIESSSEELKPFHEKLPDALLYTGLILYIYSNTIKVTFGMAEIMVHLSG